MEIGLRGEEGEPAPACSRHSKPGHAHHADIFKAGQTSAAFYNSGTTVAGLWAIRPSTAVGQQPKAQARWVWGGKEQILLRLFSAPRRAWVAILSLNGAHLHATTGAPYTSPGKQTASQMHPFLS